MPRFAVFYGYVGTYLRGVPKIGVGVDYESIQGLMEVGLNRFPVAEPPVFHYSSRTDAGVHAIRTCGHFDLKHKYENGDFSTLTLQKGLNKFFRESLRPLRVQEIKKVCDEFSARHCTVSRTYVYRFAVPREAAAEDILTDTRHNLPVTELDHCAWIIPPFDPAKALDVPKLFLGTNDFASFGKPPKRKDQALLDDRGVVKSTVRRIYECTLEPGLPFLVSPDQPRPAYDVWNFRVRASGFLYHMVRRMVGAVIAVGKGKITTAEVQYMLDKPDSYGGWNARAQTAAPDGLYLLDVEYDPRSFETGWIPEKSWSRTQYLIPNALYSYEEDEHVVNVRVEKSDRSG